MTNRQVKHKAGLKGWFLAAFIGFVKKYVIYPIQNCLHHNGPLNHLVQF